MERITENMLKRKIAYLNEITNNPAKPYENVDGKMTAQIGNYHLDMAYGGYALEQTTNDGGGVRSVFNCGHVPKRDLFERICAYIQGFEEANKPY